ncbi:MAG: nuclear transport factor 2 family protein [Alphaproteobacteria bacterium]
MTEEQRNVAIVKEQYDLWGGTKGGSMEDALSILADDIHWCSLGDANPDIPFAAECHSKDQVRAYFQRLFTDWEMMHFTVDEFIAQGDRVVALGHCAFRSRKTGKVSETRKCDVWRMKDGKAVAVSEFFDTATIVSASR